MQRCQESIVHAKKTFAQCCEDRDKHCYSISPRQSQTHIVFLSLCLAQQTMSIGEIFKDVLSFIWRRTGTKRGAEAGQGISKIWTIIYKILKKENRF